MFVRHATYEDLDRIDEIYALAKKFMISYGNTEQWGPYDYPAREKLIGDLEKDELYVVEEDGKLYAAFRYMLGEEPMYNTIHDGQWLNDKPYGTVHRLGSSGEKKGIADVVFRWCEEQGLDIRIDTHPVNRFMQNACIRNGFTYCGMLTTSFDSPRMGYQKVIEGKK